MLTIKGKYTTAHVMVDVLDEATLEQVHKMVNNPGINNKVVIMPDCHRGKGSVIGFTMPYTDRIIPNIVGVDIGCGMYTFCLSMFPNMSLKQISTLIHSVVPTGRNIHKETTIRFGENYRTMFKRIGMAEDYAARSIGTLGGGNHFIELGQANDLWYITIHTGSRNLGVKVANYHQKIADLVPNLSGEIKALRAEKDAGEFDGYELGQKIKRLKIEKEPLGYLESEAAELYLHDMDLAQKYANWNRLTIAQAICEVLEVEAIDSITSVHNFIDMEDKIMRKGAIRAYAGERLIIPLNRTFGTIIGVGKSNPDWHNSSCHGAGRTMSRKKAKQMFSTDEVVTYMKDKGVATDEFPVDEHDFAYKPPEQIIEAIRKTVDIQFIIKPVLNIKAPPYTAPWERKQMRGLF